MTTSDKPLSAYTAASRKLRLVEAMQGVENAFLTNDGRGLRLHITVFSGLRDATIAAVRREFTGAAPGIKVGVPNLNAFGFSIPLAPPSPNHAEFARKEKPFGTPLGGLLK